MNKIVFFLMALMPVFWACSSDSSSNADVNDDNKSSMLDGSSSSSSMKRFSEKDTLLYIKKICYDQVDTNHFVYVRFKSDVPLEAEPHFNVWYYFSSYRAGQSHGFSVFERGALEDFESDNGWYAMRLNLQDMTENVGSSKTTFELNEVVFQMWKPVVENLYYLKIPLSGTLSAGECIDLDNYYSLKDSSLITKYVRIDHDTDSVVDTVSSIDELKKKGEYNNSNSGKVSHYVLELGKKVYCFDGECSENSIDYPRVNLDFPEDYPIYGTFTDPRDGKVYKTTIIGMNEWFAENLNYSDFKATPNLLDQNWCYGDDEINCEKYGRLYNWAAAMDLPSAYNDSAVKQLEWYQGICPEGWHVATAQEFANIRNYIMRRISYSWVYSLLDADVWNSYQNTIYNNRTGFSVLPGGYRDKNGEFVGMGSYTFIVVTGKYLATVEDGSPSYTNSWEIRNSESNSFAESENKKTEGMYVRCVKGLGVPDASSYTEFTAQK